jgi:hypothetical protein
MRLGSEKIVFVLLENSVNRIRERFCQCSSDSVEVLSLSDSAERMFDFC